MRDFAQIRLSIWNDDEFADLSADAQLLYFTLISHPSMNRAGVGTWHAGRMAAFNRTWTTDAVIDAAVELMTTKFVVIDENTDEYLVRTFIRHDGLMKQRNLATTMAREFATIGSRTLKAVVVHELARLREEFPEWKGWQSAEAVSLLKKRQIDPSVDPSVDPSIYPSVYPSIDPKGDPSIDPSVKGEPKGSIDPSVDPSVDPSPTTTTTTSTFSRRSQRGETRKGLRGSGGEGETGNGSVASVKAESSPQNLDELAAAHADRYRCDRHKGLPDGQVPPCRACQAIREAAEESTTLAADEAKAARRAAIDACDLCDDTGHKLIDGIAYKCNHTQHAEKPAQIRDWRTKTA